MHGFKGLKKKFRKIGSKIKKGGRVLHKVTGIAKKVIDVGDKLTGGAVTKAIQSNPYGMAGLTALNVTNEATGDPKKFLKDQAHEQIKQRMK